MMEFFSAGLLVVAAEIAWGFWAWRSVGKDLADWELDGWGPE